MDVRILSLTRVVALCLWAAVMTAASPAWADADTTSLAQREEQAILAFHSDGSAARAQLRDVVTQGSSNARVHLYLALAEREQGHLGEAATVLLTGLEQPGELERELRLELAVTLSWDSKLEPAREQYATLIARDPTDQVARVGHARMLAWQGRLQQARTELTTLIEEDPDDLDARKTLAFTNAADMRLSDARSGYEAVLARDPDDTEARDGLERLSETSRIRLDAFGGYANIASLHHAGVGDLGLAIDLRASWTLLAGYATSVTRFDDPVLSGSLAQQHTPRIGVVANIRRRIYMGLHYRALIAGRDHHHGVTGEVSVKVGRALSLGAAVRPGIWADGHFDVLGRVGAEANLGRKVSVGANWYGYGDAVRNQASHAVVGRVRVTVVPRWILGAGGGWIYDLTTHGAVAMGETEIVVSDRVSLLARYELLYGTFVRHTVGLGARVSF